MSLGESFIEAVESSGLCDRIEPVEFPELATGPNGDTQRIYVRTVRGDQFKQALRSMSSPDAKGDEGRALAWGCIAFACDADGKPIWKAEHWAKLVKMPVKFLNRIFKAGLALNGMTEEAQETTRKNSDATESGDSN